MLKINVRLRFIPLIRRFFSNEHRHTAEKLFDKILIANRGEIACRIIKTAKRLGVKTVAIYSEPDVYSKHVYLADESYCVGSALPKDSYLKMNKIVEIAKESGAQAIHPGYGFLSENALFVDMVESSGLKFIGPSSGPMNEMGDKINSKRVAKDAGCFIIPGYEGEVIDEDEAVKIAKDIGYPVMIKASAGGGGKGMRIAFKEEEVKEGFRLSKAEAQSSFGDDRMLIEKYIEDPHHIEIQVLADEFGHVVAFPERECSIQRRNQKVFEESPSCLLTKETRRAMQQQARALCLATGYRSAGTVEMLADSKQNFYFLEMNTRLQVEHPITELVTGEDLVEHMLWIAAGKPLPDHLWKDNNGCLDPTGWATECRIYAEDPLRNFLPSIGPLSTYKEPNLTVASSLAHLVTTGTDDDGEAIDISEYDVTVRLDTGVREGDSISMYYDPMIAKLCTHAPSREDAIFAMVRALDEYFISGLVNNIAFLRSIFRNINFRKGNYGTKFIAEEYPDGFKGTELKEDEEIDFVAIAAAIHMKRNENSIRASGYDEDAPPVSKGKMFIVMSDNNGTQSPEHVYYVELSIEDGNLMTDVTPVENGKLSEESKFAELLQLDWINEYPLLEVVFKSSSIDANDDANTKDGGKYHSYGQHSVIVQYEGRGFQMPHTRGGAGEVYYLRLFGSQKRVEVRTPLEHNLAKYMLPVQTRDNSKYLLCPMPGTLISCAVHEGQTVEQGQQVAVVEAMKMQNILRAPKKGVIKKIKAKPGSHLKVDEVIIEFEE